MQTFLQNTCGDCFCGNIVTKWVNSFNKGWLWFTYDDAAWRVSVFGVFLVRIFPHSDRKTTNQKNKPEKLRTRTLFTKCEWCQRNGFLKKGFFIQISQVRVPAKTNAILWWKMPLMSFLVLWGIIFADLPLVLGMRKSIQIGFLGMDRFL